MNLIPSPFQIRRSYRMAALLTGAFLAGAGAAHAQTYSTTIVAPSQVTVATFNANTNPANTPTFNESFVGGGNAVPYAAQTFTPTAAATYQVATTVTGGYSGGGSLVQFLYAPTFNAASPSTNYVQFFQPSSSAINYSVNLAANQEITLVDGGISNTDRGTAQTIISQYNPGSTSTIPDNSPAGVSQVLNVSANSSIASFNSITIDGLNDSFIGDLTATLTHNGVTVDLFDHTGADNDPNDPNYNYGQGSQATFNGGNYTFALNGASLAAVADATAAPSNVTYAAAGNAAGGFDQANANNTLNSFYGQNVAGSWILSISDNQPDDVGSFTGFSFNVTPQAVPEVSSGLNFGVLLSLIVMGRVGMGLRARRRSNA